RELRQRRAHRLQTTLDGARGGVVQGHTAAGGGDDLGDAAAHLTRADDEDVFERHARCASRATRPRFTVQPTPNAFGVRTRARSGFQVRARRRSSVGTRKSYGTKPKSSPCIRSLRTASAIAAATRPTQTMRTKRLAR